MFYEALCHEGVRSLRVFILTSFRLFFFFVDNPSTIIIRVAYEMNSPRESNGNDSRTNSPKAFEAETFVGYDDSDSDGQDSDGLGFVGDESDEDGYEEDNFGGGGGGENNNKT